MAEVAPAPAPAIDTRLEAQNNGDAVEVPAHPNGEASNAEHAASNDSDKAETSIAIPMTAHEKERKQHESERTQDMSERVKEGKRWNQRDRPYQKKSEGRPPKNFKRNNKFDPTTLPESDDPVAIRKQVEFYFSTSNLLQDKFLFTKMEGHKNVPVPIDIIHSFKRMQHFQPRSAVVSALKDSTLLEVVNDDNDIQRRVPIAEELTGKSMDEVRKVQEDESMARSVYAKGFGEEEASTQFDIEAFFSNYGAFNAVRLRRDTQRYFKGSVFVEFDNEDTAKKFCTIDPPPKYRDKPLKVVTKKQYCDEKVDAINEGRIRKNSPSSGDRRGGYSDRRRNDDHRDLDKHDDRDWRLRRQEDAEGGFPERRNRDNRHDKKRGHRGFGSAGRGRGGRRGRGRERDEGRRTREERSSSEGVGSGDSQAEAGGKDDTVPAAPTTGEGKEPTQTPVSSKKRSRDDDQETGVEDGAKETPLSKRHRGSEEAEVQEGSGKLETSSKKRQREDDENEVQREPKKVDLKEG